MSTRTLTEILSLLIATPSVNPAHSHNPDITGEKHMAELFIQLFNDFGLEVEILYPIGPDRPAVIGRSQPARIRSTLMFEMHLDTVSVSGMTVDPFSPKIHDNKIYGRGACDMKGSMAALFYALNPERIQALADRGIQLMLVGAPDEEAGLVGATHLAAEGLRADHAIILEPTRCLPVIAHKSARKYQVDLYGRAGHGSQPKSGVSTNTALAQFLPGILNIHADLNQKYQHLLLGKSSLNLGKISGGDSFNIIPDHTQLLLDRRVIPNEPPHLFHDQVNQLLRTMIEQKILVGGDMHLHRQSQAFSTDEQSPLVKSLQTAITRVTGEPAPCGGTSWVSDASPFSTTCGQVLVFGPGDIDQAHTENEYIEISQLERGAAILGDFLDHVHFA
ncbi:M20/M25/M40 family metallo-hydrolase [Kiritimatiellaeota bacterium B1221]|nr:M20/M25/M40 family metallo-hydrolase [Kiritimatiellaeota bacterium B1221]